MKLRSGLVLKVQNIDHLGRQALKSKGVLDLYENGQKSIVSTALLPEIPGFSFDCAKVEIESQCQPLAEINTIAEDQQTNMSDDGNSGHGRKIGSDDLNFLTTLTQLKENCKVKKRKLSEFLCLTEGNVGTFCIKHDEPKDEEFDQKVPLINLKSKLLKNSETKKMRIKAEKVSNDEDCKSCDESATIDIKAVLPVSNDPDTLKIMCTAYDCSFRCKETMGSSELFDETFEDANGYVTKSGVARSFSKEELPSCITEEVLCEYVDCNELNSWSKFMAEVNVGNPEMTNPQPLPLAVFDLKENLPALEMKEGVSFNHPLPIVIYQGALSSTKDRISDMHVSRSCIIVHESSQGDIKDSAGIQAANVSNDNRQCNEFDYGSRQCVDGNHNKNALTTYHQTVTTGTDCCSHQNSHWCSSPIISCLHYSSDSTANEVSGWIRNNAGIQVVEMTIDDKLECNEINYGGGLVSSVECDGLPLVERVNDVAPINFSAGSPELDAKNELMLLAVISSNFCLPTIRDAHPRRLLSTRKGISPNPQERLCQAVKSTELNNDIKHYKSEGNVCLGKTTRNEASLAGSIWTKNELDVNPNEGINGITVRKPKIERNSSHPLKGILKNVPHHSIQHCSRNAVTFSQMQMRTTKSVATELMTQLNSIKHILEKKLRPGACSASADEVGIAIQNASKAEAYARRWISMLEKDCASFCRLMRKAGNGAAATAASGNVTQKGKKFKFADEVGRALSEVRIFESD